jgi:outer membrane protein insertion porin family
MKVVKYFFVSLFFSMTALYAVSANAVIANEIIVQGNHRIEVDTVKAYLPIKEGDNYTQEDLDESLKVLYNSGLFADIFIESKGKNLIVKVVENPIINRIAFEGNKRIEDDKLMKEIQLKPRLVFSRKKVQADVQRLLMIYQKTGRFSATIDPKIIQLDQNRVDLVFEVNEGPATEVKKIRFIGNHKYAGDKLERIISTKEWRWYRFFNSDDIYDPDRIEYDKELLRRFYWDQGYADFQISSVVSELSQDKKNFFITFTIKEGEKYEFGNVDVSSDIRNLNLDPLKKALTIKSGDRYSRQHVEDSIKALTEEAAEQQYAFVDIHPRIKKQKETKTVDIDFVVEEGEKVFVERININGNVRTLDKVIRREMKIIEGDPYNKAKLHESELGIRRLNFFEKVEVDSNEGSADDLSVIDVQVEEKSTGSMNFGIGYGTNEGGLIKFGIRERNLLGKGQDLDLAANVSKRKATYKLGFTEPKFMDKDLAVGGDVFHAKTNFSRESSYNEENTGGTIRMAYPITDNLAHAVHYTFLLDNITDVKETASRFIQEEKGKKYVSSIGHTLMYDKRDIPHDPSSGYYINLSQSLAGLGGNVRYINSTLRAAYFVPLYDQAVLSFLGEGGYIFGLGQDVRISDRFYMGGDNMRGFRSGGIGPRDLSTGDALGGNRYYRFSSELTTPIGIPEEFGIKGHFFVDVGSLGKIDQSARAGDRFVSKETPRVSVGTAISWISPMGPLRFEFAKAVVKEDFDRAKVFRLTYSSAF